MTIYVDPLFTWIGDYRDKDAARTGGRNRHQWCHMFGDKTDYTELHNMAQQIGLRREWFQENHYDLTPVKRALAIRLGAVEIDRMQAILIRRKLRKSR
jgi:hypothetical protein